MGLRQAFVDSPESVGARLRARRFQMMIDSLPELTEMAVLDLGGTAEFWRHLPVRPRSITLLNATVPSTSADGGMPDVELDVVVGDACDPPADVAGRRFDLVFSNSVIEHVGGLSRRQAFADVVRRSAPRHWIQTPYRYFPIEPHWLFPGFQFLPVNVRAALSRSWPLVHTRSSGVRESVATALDVELIGLTEFRYLFPGSDILREHVAGLTKSIVAARL